LFIVYRKQGLTSRLGHDYYNVSSTALAAIYTFAVSGWSSTFLVLDANRT